MPEMSDGPTLPGLIPGPAASEVLCASAQLEERGRAVVWDVMLWGRPARAFALRFDGKPVAYLNRCLHVPTEMDWQEGQFLDIDKRWILCSIHGAAYEPADGRCVGGPCGRGKLTPERVAERDGQVHWYPSRDIVPVPFDEVSPSFVSAVAPAADSATASVSPPATVDAPEPAANAAPASDSPAP